MNTQFHESKLSNHIKFKRFLWSIVWLLLYRPSPIFFHFWRRFLLRCFGATVCKASHPYPSARIWAPWNLVMGEHSCLSHYVDCYCVDKISLGDHATVSQYSFLCTASRDYNRPDMPLLIAPIVISEHAWVTSDVFVAPGVTIGQGAVVMARSTVLYDVKPWSVVAGNPAKKVAHRDMNAILEGRSNV
jgi:putative colanic acid biosynthesis acetyltransferase WcaF